MRHTLSLLVALLVIGFCSSQKEDVQEQYLSNDIVPSVHHPKMDILMEEVIELEEKNYFSPLGYTHQTIRGAVRISLPIT